MAQLHVETGRAAGAQGIDGGDDDLKVGLDAVRTDELHTALGDLPVSTVVGGVGAVYLLVVIQPLRQGQRAQLGSRHPGNGGGGVGAHDADLATQVAHLQHPFLRDGAA